MSGELAESYRNCVQVARRAASNFYWSFWLLPKPKRLSTCALYAFSRHCDDLADNDRPADERRQALDQWRASLEQALAGQCDDPLLPALADTVGRYEIPREHLFDIIEGVMMDLEPRRYTTFDELSEYCRKVAAAVGLACLHIWGFRDESAFPPAVNLGLAFQLTNILRDLTEDARHDRLYLPLEDLERFDYSFDDLKRGVADERFTALVRFEIDRAKQLYRDSAPLADCVERDGRRVLGLMTATYRALLAKIERASGDVLVRPVQLGFARKVSLAARAILGGSQTATKP
jgi:phytoene synthase